MSSPYLHAYFQERFAHCGSSCSFSEETTAELVRIIEDSFSRHDKDNTGELSDQEAFAFFAHYIEEYARYRVTLFEATAPGTMRQFMGHRPTERQKADMKKDVPIQKQKMRKAMKAITDDYFKNENTRARAAFGVVDLNRDGKLQRQEVIGALLPKCGSTHHERFHKALGIDDVTIGRTASNLGVYSMFLRDQPGPVLLGSSGSGAPSQVPVKGCDLASATGYAPCS